VKDGDKLIVRTRHPSFLGGSNAAGAAAGVVAGTLKQSRSTRMRAPDGSEVDAHLPSAESLIITLAAAERDIMGLEVENNKYRMRIAEILAEKVELGLRADKFERQLELKIEEFNALKKTNQEMKYNLTRNEKRIELRFLELTDARAKYAELDKRTTPLIASLQTKVTVTLSYVNLLLVCHKSYCDCRRLIGIHLSLLFSYLVACNVAERRRVGHECEVAAE
jgi:hypothetical protein